MSARTTILLDDRTRLAARDLALELHCSTSEAIRRAVVGYRDLVIGASPEFQAKRREALDRAFALFEGSDPAEEIRRLKREDEGS